MKKPYSNTAKYIAQLQSIEQQINQNQLQEAVQQLNQLSKTSSHDPRLFLLGSRLAEAAGNPDGMLQAARKAHELEPQWPDATIHLARVLAERNETAEAMSMAEQALQQVFPQDRQTTKHAELLVKAATMAQRLKQYPQALPWLRQAAQISPEDLSIRYQLALTLTNSGDHAGAIEILTDLLQLRPSNTILLNDRLRACLSVQQTTQAIQDAEALLALEPDNEAHRFYYDIARGLTPKTQPASVVLGVFDGRAAQFDQYLAVQSNYTLPRDVASMIIQWHPDRKLDVLDLGCGTGQLGAGLGPVDGALIGVDLSQEMINKAIVHHVYHRFHRVNILDALEATPSDHYDLIAALDVMGFIGDLGTVIPNAHRILTNGGRFVFSCETGSEGDYTLQNSYRYTHRRGYVERLLQEAGFEDIEIKDLVLRFEAGRPVQGFLVVARKRQLEA